MWKGILCLRAVTSGLSLKGILGLNSPPSFTRLAQYSAAA